MGIMNRKKRSLYITIATVVFIIEILIERYLNDPFIRPYLGDALVVILIYAALMSISNLKPFTALWMTLLFSYTVEFFQYLKLIEWLGIAHLRLARAVLGTSFSWMDIAMYSLGIFSVFIWEYTTYPKTKNQTDFR
jgi:hypothetical protein